MRKLYIVVLLRHFTSRGQHVLFEHIFSPLIPLFYYLKLWIYSDSISKLTCFNRLLTYVAANPAPLDSFIKITAVFYGCFTYLLTQSYVHQANRNNETAS